MKHKLFIWHGVLCDFGCGFIAVIAKNLKRARELALKSSPRDSYTLEENEPDIYDMTKEAVIECWGTG